MATQKATIEFLLAKLRPSNRFSARAMFGEYALYADGKVVALVCDDLLYVKIVPARYALEPLCEQGEPYPGAKPHYIVEERAAFLCASVVRNLVRHRRVSAGEEKESCAQTKS